MSGYRFWRLRFSLRSMILMVAVIAIALAGFDGWRRARNARSARAEFVKLLELWEAGVNIPTDDVIAAFERTFQAERRQWFSSLHKRAIIDSHILRLTRIRDGLQSIAQTGLFDSEEAHAAAWKRVEDVSRLIEDAEKL